MARRVADDPPRGEWFADEIAIDFPSVGAAVDRMRDAFLAPDELPRALNTQIVLSALEALTGTVVPLDLPVRGTCQACGGRGETWTEPCRDCRGSGEALFLHAVQVSVPPRIADGACIRLHVSAPSRASDADRCASHDQSVNRLRGPAVASTRRLKVYKAQ